MRVKSNTMNIYVLDNETRENNCEHAIGADKALSSQGCHCKQFPIIENIGLNKVLCLPGCFYECSRCHLVKMTFYFLKISLQ